MSNAHVTEDVSVEFIRLFFRSPLEEEIGYRWATRLGKLLGGGVTQLRPDTTLGEILNWAAVSGVDSMDFVVVFEPELRLEFGDFLDDPEHSTFRDMVEYCARHILARA